MTNTPSLIWQVRENLIFSASLRLPAGTSEERKEALVDDAITLLGLRHVQDIVVGTTEQRGISGGQLKRVNIGLELVADPTLLFLDEPTSGLDSTASLEVLGALRALSRLGVTVVTVIHQPRYSIFAMWHISYGILVMAYQLWHISYGILVMAGTRSSRCSTPCCCSASAAAPSSSARPPPRSRTSSRSTSRCRPTTTPPDVVVTTYWL